MKAKEMTAQEMAAELIYLFDNQNRLQKPVGCLKPLYV